MQVVLLKCLIGFQISIEKAMFTSPGKKIDADIMQYEVKELPGIEIYRHDDGRVFVRG